MTSSYSETSIFVCPNTCERGLSVSRYFSFPMDEIQTRLTQSGFLHSKQIDKKRIPEQQLLTNMSYFFKFEPIS